MDDIDIIAVDKILKCLLATNYEPRIGNGSKANHHSRLESSPEMICFDMGSWLRMHSNFLCSAKEALL
jgi:hypothetical protein